MTSLAGIPPETWHTVGTAIGAIISGVVLVVSRGSLKQLQGPKDKETGQHGKCVRDLLLEVMVSIKASDSVSEMRHQERILAFEEMKKDFGRLEFRVKDTEDTLRSIKLDLAKK